MLWFFNIAAQKPYKIIRWNELEFCKKCAEMRWFFKIFGAKTLHNKALKCSEMHWNFLRNALIFQYCSPKTLHNNALKCTGTLQEMRWNALIFQKFSAEILHNNAPKCAEMHWNFLRNALIFQNFQRKNLTKKWAEIWWNALELCQKCAEMRLFFIFQKFQRKNLSKKCAELCWYALIIRKNCAEFSSLFLQSFSAFQHISAHYCVRFLRWTFWKKRISAHFLHIFWKISRPGKWCR